MSESRERKTSGLPLAIYSRGIRDIPHLEAFLGHEVAWRPADPSSASGVAVWGYKPSGRQARAVAARLGLKTVYLEDGFIKSLAGARNTARARLSMTVDLSAPYYDSSRPSDLETMLGVAQIDPASVLEAARLRQRVLELGVSKYGRGNDPVGLPHGPFILIVDQVHSDESVRGAGSSTATFRSVVDEALAAARSRGWRLAIKPHPAAPEGGHIARSWFSDKDPVHWLSADDDPIRVCESAEEIWVVSSNLGFEALMLGKKVVCFGVPWYSGWGLTEDRGDREALARRLATRSLDIDEIFHIAYVRYPRYVNPASGERCGLSEILDHIALQRKMAMELGSEPIFVGFQHWKRSFIRAFCGLGDAEGKFVRSVPGSFGDRDRIHVWGSRTPDEDIERIPAGCGPVRIEDGFLRSVGLGSDFAEPLSLVVDPHGIYYDATRPSALELFLESHAFTPEELLRARTLRSTILRYDLNKYNLPKAPADHLASSLRRTKKLKILIPGQVEDDASIVYGAGTVRTMLELVAQVRTYRPDAFIVYRPHPEVLSRNRIAESNLSSIRSLVDCVETMTDTHTCGTMVDEVHTLTSLVGFEMLMRGLPVVTYGQPFYAGWGLTDDRELIRPRKRALELDELIYGALIEYPRYFDLRHGCFISPECAARLLAGRIAAPRPSVGVVARKISKARAWLGLWRGGGRWS